MAGAAASGRLIRRSHPSSTVWPKACTRASTWNICSASTRAVRATATASSSRGRSRPTAPRFTGNVKLKGIIIMGEDDDSHSSEMRLYKNIAQMSFDDTDREPDQTFSLNRDLTGELEYATKISHFSDVYQLSIHISKNFGVDTTKVFYIGQRGEWTELCRHEVTICNYEASANPADHRVHQVTP
ncbi:hypothetical protein mRhiFer1_008244 [Rhinolophus ferrumequinum]|uniref:PITH domain-containing protein n=1 Tax=Rhinolophus ferrumequinum TaxID=59479 RepID=A0A7J7VR33_RHIFE|nr:hypothetical protein mRhiFer1_008244 [Rhinolophus ferrumequinum]